MTKNVTPTNARNLEQKRILEEFQKTGKDPFDRDNVEKIGNTVIFENKHWYAMKNKWPYKGSKHHIVVVCKRSILDLSEQTLEELKFLQQIQSQVINHYNITGGCFCMRFGDPKKSGTTCTRLHGHILVPKRNQLITFPIGKFKKPENE